MIDISHDNILHTILVHCRSLRDAALKLIFNELSLRNLDSVVIIVYYIKQMEVIASWKFQF